MAAAKIMKTDDVSEIKHPGREAREHNEIFRNRVRPIDVYEGLLAIYKTKTWKTGPFPQRTQFWLNAPSKTAFGG